MVPEVSKWWAGGQKKSMDTMMILRKKFIKYKEFFTHTNGTFVKKLLVRLIKYKFLGVKVKLGSEISLSYLM